MHMSELVIQPLSSSKELVRVVMNLEMNFDENI